MPEVPTKKSKATPVPNDQFIQTVKEESSRFQEYYLWLEKQMPKVFYEEVSREYLIVIAHSLMGFHLQDYFCNIHLSDLAFVLCTDSPDADIKILKNYSMVGIKNYQAFVSNTPPPVPGIKGKLRIGAVFFTEARDSEGNYYNAAEKEQLRALVKQRNPNLSDEDFDQIISSMSARFLRSLSTERLILTIDMFFRAKTRDPCQFEVRYNEDWQEKSSVSMQIVLAWRNTPKYNFLYRIARLVHRHGLMMQRVNTAYVNSYSKDGILVMVLGLHGSNGQAAWDAADILDFLHELVTIKYFNALDVVDKYLVTPGIISGNMGNFIRSVVNFVHQALVHIDPNLYTFDNINEVFSRHPELTVQLCEAFKAKFDPWNNNYDAYLRVRKRFINDVNRIDTGHEENDVRRKNVLTQAMNFIHYTLKTNFFRLNLTALSFRLDPKYLDEIPFIRKEHFPELPYGIIFIKGLHFFAFHIRFKDLARGGIRSIYPEQIERMLVEINNVFTECYNLAYTQNKKNKDIPEGGAKAVIFVKPFSELELETEILSRELEAIHTPPQEITWKVDKFRKEQRLEYLYHAQRSFVEALITIVNCEPNGKLRAKHVMDYWKKPEYLYLGPDEGMHDSMIEWIADYSKRHDYKPGSAFISGKPVVGINHKHYGVTSLGINVYMEQVLKFLGIDPYKDVFTIKISGGPDGDVAGNQICNLHKFYPKTAKLVALTDVSGTIYDPDGLNLEILVELFKQVKPIRYYPPAELHEGGFLVDRESNRTKNNLVQHTLCWKKTDGKIIEEWLSGNDMNHLWRNNLNKVKADIFIPGGGRPRTLNGSNIQDFLDEQGKPTARAIIEGANLYLDNDARHFLEDCGVLIIKDSSANKTGVICSSFEVLCGLTLGDELFCELKETLIEEILVRLRRCAMLEAKLLLTTYSEKGGHLTDISDTISERINLFTDQLLHYLDQIELPTDPNHPLIRCFLSYCLPILRQKYADKLLTQIPDNHKKAIIASHLAADTVYVKGLDWSPAIVDVLPVLLEQIRDPDKPSKNK